MSDFQFRSLTIDLATGSNTIEAIKTDVMQKYLGGSSLGAYLLFPELSPTLDPLSPEAPLAFLTGPLTGTSGPAVARSVICGKSPLTGIWAESNIGGYFGTELRKAGFDVLIVRGCAASPVYLWINGSRAELRPADHLWGTADTYQTQELIKNELGQSATRVACIGIAGERQIPYAGILCDHGRVAGRTGLGAVMGSKNLKAIAVRGRGSIHLDNPREYAALRTRVNRELKDDLVSVGMRDFGTSSTSDLFDYFGLMPKKNYSSGVLEGTEKVSGSAVAETMLSGISACHACVIACGRKVKLMDGIERKGPEFETTVGFGPNLGITDLSFITRMGDICDRYGIDTISLSNTIGVVLSLYEAGLITTKDSGGDEFLWGDHAVVEKLVHQTVLKEGLGAIIAQGARALGDYFDSPNYAVEVKGLEVPYHDPRGASGMALVYATSPRGACHNQGPYYLVELGQTIDAIGVDFFKRQAGAEKVANIIRHQNWTSVVNALVMCIFANVPPSDTCKLIQYATGYEYSLNDLLLLGERSWNIRRMVNHRLKPSGLGDALPERFKTPLAEGGASGYSIPFEEMLFTYYNEREWDSDTGIPTANKLRELGLDDL
ncbi:MAG: aldehyde ferredoxin oxidoreductase family protein [Anaerolineales bacterium]|nr:aldehyde ferredoxin oxidoreductase family protein [Anaerolineales bacterium]